MPEPLDIIARQSLKTRLPDNERIALERARRSQQVWGLIGVTGGGVLGLYLSRRNPSKYVRAAMIICNGMFMSSIAAGVASYRGIVKLNDETKYPHIAAAFRDITQEIARSRGFDPNHPERGRIGAVPHRPDFEHLPPSKTAAERENRHSEFGSAYDDFGSPDYQQHESQQHQFGNPNLHLGQEPSYQEFGNPNLPAGQQQQQQQFGNPSLGQQPQFGNPSLSQQQQQKKQPQWDSPSTAIASSASSSGNQTNPWDKLRSQQAQQNTTSGGQSRSSWGDSSQGDGFDSSNGLSMASEDFPRAREDFGNLSDSSDGKSSGPTFAT
ncbi:hypothetical protein COEREDRAFT_90625 [Coemansia reversa NRRL 1564]|uniref:Uncharacterized protein n=1 Tax=Coemansia reversa (strain ATCC 12441 / NRRL 1564) TaxID=763665 RepID=A0A2G5BJY2_COERN|nr:hypothetical protein COEREDRAFT_90625 [Coemansia reversa NRRL 1564]|eukprot:PIA19301.1 hypothetical protein COEREDRAFT_90625 [Coemansia reversa NRRL 1564]